MKFFKKISLSYSLLLIIIIGLLFIYRQVIFDGKILFPSNFLAQFYSPWKTEKFSGWEAGIPHKPIGDDQIRIFYPSRTFTNTMFEKKTIPLWNPYIFAGSPHMADFQSAVFYPLNIIYFFLPQITAWSFLLFIQPIMAAFFMYLFLNLFRLNKSAIWLGTIAYGFSGFILLWSQENVVVGQSALWLPLALFGIERYLITRKHLYYLVAILALACSFLAGFFQITFYIFAFSFFYGLIRIKTLKLPFSQYSFKIISIYIFSLCLSAMQLIPSIEAFLESPRSTSSAWYLFESYLLPITHVFNALVPDIFGNPGAYNFFGRGFYRETILYVGLIPLFFAIYAGFRRKTNPVILFFIGAAILSFFLTLDSPFTRWFFRLPLPLLPTFLPSRIFIITAFSIAALSSFGLSILIEKKEKNDRKLILNILSVFYLCLLLVFLYGILLLNYGHAPFFKQLNDYIIRYGSIPTKMNILVLLKNLILPFSMISLFFVLILNKKKKNFFLFGTILLTLFGQFYFLNKYLVVGERQFLYPKSEIFSFLKSKNDRGRFISLGQPIQENTSTIMGAYSIEGVNPVFPKKYGQLLFAVNNNGKVINNIPRVEARLSEIDDKKESFDDIRLLRLLSLLNTKYILYYYDPKIPKIDFSSSIFKPVWSKDNWHIFEYRKTLPRTFLANNVYIESDQQRILDLVFDPKIDLSSSIILEEKPNEVTDSGKFINMDKPSPDSSVSITSYEPQKVEIETNTDKPQMLFLSDNYYPGWKAYVDNKETKIYRADYTFRSIYLPKGNHTITFKYQPMSFKIGSTVSILSIIAMLVFIFLKRNKIRII